MKKMTRGGVCAIYWAGLIMAMTSFCCNGEEPMNKPSGTNIALGKPYVMTPAPNYKLCKDEGDSRQLTDGAVYADGGSLWTQKGTVGWHGVQFAMITVDLGNVEPIDGVRFHSAFDGTNNVQWPSSIGVYVSEDGKDYVFAKELVDPAWKDDGLPPELSPFSGQHTVQYWYRAEGLATKGRFVSFVGRSPSFFFCDEVEVLRGADDLLKELLKGKRLGDLSAYVYIVQPYLAQDMAGVRKNAAGLSEERKKMVEQRLADVELQMARMTMDEFQTPGYRAVAPLNAVQRKIFEINGEVLRLRKAPPLLVWHKHRWDPLEATEVPAIVMPQSWWKRIFSSVEWLPENQSVKSPELALELMNGEYRSEVLNLTNTKQEEIEARIWFRNLPGGRAPEYIRLHSVEYVAAREKMIADALPEAKKDGNGYMARIPAGMTRQIWIALHPQDLKAGTYPGEVVIENGKKAQSFGFVMKISPERFPDHPYVFVKPVNAFHHCRFAGVRYRYGFFRKGLFFG